jgi:NAD(P)H-dependent FMN reductase
LKNAYDWISRGETPIKEKPAAMVSSAAMTGGMRAQAAMRNTVEYCKVKVMEKP